MPKLAKEPIRTLEAAGDFISINETGLILGCSSGTVRRLVRARKLTSIKLLTAAKIETKSIRALIAASYQAAA